MSHRPRSQPSQPIPSAAPTPPPPPPPPASPRSWRGAAGWACYFPDELEDDESCAGRSKIVSRLSDFFLTEPGRAILSSVPPNSFGLPLVYDALRRASAPQALRALARIIPDTPETALPCIGLGAARAAEALAETDESMRISVGHEHRLWPRIFKFNPLTPMRSLRGNSVGRFVAVRGTVVRVSNIRQQVTAMRFECTKCGEEVLQTFADYKFNPPTSCAGDDCRSRTFLPMRETAETVDWQKIRVQEIVDRDDEAAAREEGRMPRTIDAELFADLIDSCVPGDTVTVCGVVRVLSVDVAGGGGGGNGGGGPSKASKAGKCLYYLYLEANSTESSRRGKSKEKACAPGEGDLGGEEAKVHELIHEVVQEKDPFAYLVHSTVPSIYGHELVKAGMLLALFGGSQKKKEHVGGSKAGDGDVAIRRDVHCLVVGDPGLGKSQMLKAVSNIAPRGVYVCGNTTTTAGLTVTVVREASGDFALEAGALVLGDRGVCCIDEFDKMGADHGALLEAMEQQSVSVAKAGMLCNLSARTTVIAAANPVGGHYDRSKTVCENLKIALPLLSRFDLCFILVDNPDEERDRFISEHVMAMFGMRNQERHRGSAAGSSRVSRRGGPSNGPSPSQDGSESLAKRLRKSVVHDPLPTSLFRQYIAYAKEHVHPELSEGAKAVLQDFYLTLRKGAHEQAADTTPITTRQLESLIRLSQARARSVMRTEVSVQDAQDVVEIMRESMMDVLTDETGGIDLSRSTGMSRAKDARLFVAALQAEAELTRSSTFDKIAMRRVAERIGVDSGTRFDNLIETINYQGYVTLKGRGRYELRSSSFSMAPGQGRTQTEGGRSSQGRGAQVRPPPRRSAQGRRNSDQGYASQAYQSQGGPSQGEPSQDRPYHGRASQACGTQGRTGQGQGYQSQRSGRSAHNSGRSTQPGHSRSQGSRRGGSSQRQGSQRYNEGSASEYENE